MENIENEIWKDIPSYEGKYQVSNFGRVKSFYFGKENIRKPSLSKGYYGLHLVKKQKLKTWKIHQLMAFVFWGHVYDKEKKIVVDHIDNNPLNNRLDNLQLITNRENASKDKKGYTSSYVGVSLNFKKKWVSHIQYKKRKISLGTYNTEYEAHLAYQKALNEIKQELDLNKLYPKKENSSIYQGVYYSKERNRWIASFNGKKIKNCKTEMEAKETRDLYLESAHKFEINGYWLMLDPNADEATIEQVQDFLYEVKKTCLNCKYKELSLAHSICWNCSELEMNKTIVGCISNWEAKQ